jgi:alkylation response protein AidB-like acyl-CoA dehydrogenase
MNFELEPVSAAGARLVELAEKHAAEFAGTAGEYDRAGGFPFPHWAQLRAGGLLAASVPAQLGGLGVDSVQDLVVAVGRLARGDASIAIGAAMHLSAFWYFSRMPAAPAPMKLLLRRCARGRVVACVAISEPGTAIGWPRTTARPAEGGYRIDGRKTFCTNSPVATVFLSTVRIGDAEQLGFALVPRETAGVTVLDNWDALGMRGSGSNDVVFDGCPVPAGMVVPAGPLGQLPTAMLPFTMAGALLLVGAALGIAERAQELVAQPAAGRPVRPEVARLVAENEVDLAVGRAAVGRAAALLDDRLPAGPSGPQLHELMSQVQCVNVAVKRAAIAIVDRALTVSGGRGYLSSSPLSRLYRDVRAGPFMQPFSALDADEYIGRIRLGLEHT